MRKHYTELTATGAQIIIVTPSPRTLLEPFVEAFGPYPFPLYGDPTRALYKDMGHVTMAKWKLLAKAAKGYLKGGAKAFLPEKEDQQTVVKEAMKTQDLYIQGGTWIFDDKGQVTWSHIDKAPEDHARITDILQQLT